MTTTQINDAYDNKIIELLKDYGVEAHCTRFGDGPSWSLVGGLSEVFGRKVSLTHMDGVWQASTAGTWLTRDGLIAFMEEAQQVEAVLAKLGRIENERQVQLGQLAEGPASA